MVVDQVLTKGELFEQLVARSPTADIEIGGVPVSCVLDTGAETSLIPASFYHEHLTVWYGERITECWYLHQDCRGE